MEIDESVQEKRLLRNEYRALRDAQTPQERARMDALLCGQVLASRAFAECELLLCYVSVGSEADTRALISRALAAARPVAVPRCRPGTREMSFLRITSLSELAPGRFGIPEPPAQNPAVEPDRAEKALCLVPALCFDESGARLGYGGGYYDRFLPHFSGMAAGFCHSPFLRAQPLPVQPHDRLMQLVFTDRGVVKTHKRDGNS